MEDEQILDLYFARNERAIIETKQKYHHYLFRIAYHILENYEDCEESVSDTYLRAWNAIPPNRPERLSAWLGEITRRLAIDCYRRHTSQKRGSCEYALSLEELSDCVSGERSLEQEAECRQLGEAISRYLYGLPAEQRNMFLYRYYFCDSIRDIAGYVQGSEAKVKSSLYRTRKDLQKFLEKEGYV